MPPTRASILALAVALVVAPACGGTPHQPWASPTTRDAHEDPARLRPGYGNADLHFWFPLTAPEADALRALPQAKQGDPHALLSLGILASSTPRDAGSYARYAQRVAQFVADVRPTIDGAADDWHRGYELNRAMHRVFFNGERTDLGAYELHQGRLAGIFDGGRYNCISSAMLYAVLARELGMAVRGVLVPTHAFIELGALGGKVFEVETTSDTGFDLVHDQRFFRESASQWSSKRGLRPVTPEDYEHRCVAEPYRLMASAMGGQAGIAQGEDQGRLAEAWAFVDGDDVEAQRARLTMYVNEARALYEAKAARTRVQMFEVVRPVLADAAGRWSGDAKAMRLVAWMGWYGADALLVTGRGDEAVAIADEMLPRVDASWEDGTALRQNFLAVLDDRMLELMTAKDYAAASKVMVKHLDACRALDTCARNLEVVHFNWSVEFQRVGDWQGARQALSECVAQLPGSAACGDALRDLESRHRF